MYSRTVLALIAAAFLVVASTTAFGASVPLSYVNDREILVKFKPSAAVKSASAFAARKGVSFVKTVPLSYATIQKVRVSESDDFDAKLAELDGDPLVEYAYPNVIKTPSHVPNDPYFLNGLPLGAFDVTDQYALMLLDAVKAWDYSAGSESVVVAIVDTGIFMQHPDLASQLWTKAGSGEHGYDFAVSPAVADPSDKNPATEWHGTSVAGIIGASTGNGVGIAGAAGGRGVAGQMGVRLMIVRVGTDTQIAVDAEVAGIDYAVQNGARVINMSFGGPSGGTPEQSAMENAWNHGVVLCAAGGNVGANSVTGIDYPGAFPQVIAVGATTIFTAREPAPGTPTIAETLADFSKKGNEMEVVAPGVGILTTFHDSYTRDLNAGFAGTSASTPFVTALAALLIAVHPGWTNQQVRNEIDQSTIHMGAAGRNQEYGFGRIDYLTPFIIDGDTNVDRRVDDADVIPLVAGFGKMSGQPAYSAAVDTNRDGVIDELDLFAVGRNYGQTQP